VGASVRRGLSEPEGSEVESCRRKNTAAEPQDAKAEEGCGSSRAGRGGGRKRQGCVCLMGWACACVLCGVCVGKPGGKNQANQTRKRKRCKQQACCAGRVLEKPRTREMTGHKHNLSKPSFAKGFLCAHVVRRDKGTITPAMVRINKRLRWQWVNQ